MKRFLALIVVAVAALAAVGVPTGHTGWALGVVRVHLAPRDAGLLQFFERDAKWTVVGQVPYLPRQGGILERVADVARDLEQVTAIRPALDIDAVAVGEDVQVARGRFAWSRMSPALAKNGYLISTDRGFPFATRESDDDALAVVGGYLVHGTVDAVKRALERKVMDKGVKPEGALVGEMDAIGWRHGLFAVAVLDDKGTSVGQILSGGVDVKAVALTIDDADRAYPLEATVRAGTRTQARDIQEAILKARDEVVKHLDQLDEADSIEVGLALSKSTVVVDEDGRVVAHIDMPKRVVDKMAGKAKESFGALDVQKSRATLKSAIQRALAK